MIKRTKILKTRCKYTGLCNQGKKIILFFVPGQVTLLLFSAAKNPQGQVDLPQTSHKTGTTFLEGNFVLHVRTLKIFLSYDTTVLFLGIHQRN